MASRRPWLTAASGFTAAVTVALGAAFAVWTLLQRSGALRALDESTVATQLEPTSDLGQIALAISLATSSLLLLTLCAGIALWAYRRRLRNLSYAILLSAFGGWAASELLKSLFRRSRPDSLLDFALTARGWAYPSTHATVITIVAMVVVATTTITRQRPGTVIAWRLVAAAAVLLVVWDRWVMNAHWLSDIVGGVLLGGFVTSSALLLLGVTTLPESLGFSLRVPAPLPKRLAVVFNPDRVADLPGFRRRVEYELRHRHWDRGLWLETSAEDPGVAMTRKALRRRADVVLAVGGDGTVRAVAGALTGTGVPLAVIPAGTGNLLARNLGIPLDEEAALTAVFDGAATPLDLVSLRADAGPETLMAVMAGIGMDARIMAATSPDLKKAVGPAAYFLNAPTGMVAPHSDFEVTVDDQPGLRLTAAVVVVANVGDLVAGIRLLPDATPDDGLLDVLVATPRQVGEWARVAGDLLLGAPAGDLLQRTTGTRVRIEAGAPTPYQVDGDWVGEARVLEAEVVPGAIRVLLP